MVGRAVQARLLAALPLMYQLTSPGQFPLHALTVTRQLLGGDKGVYTELDRSTGDFRVLVDPQPVELGGLHEARVAFMPQHPVLTHSLVNQPAESRTISDYLSSREFHRLGLYGEFFDLIGVEDQITILITAPGVSQAAAVSIDRGRRGFTDDDRWLLAALRPHLEMARHNALRFAAAAPDRSRQLDTSATIERLTDRQREVLSLITDGRTNLQIANHLDLSPQTVRKHVENILGRLGVSNRTSAAIAYSRAGAGEPARSWTAQITSMVPAAAL